MFERKNLSRSLRFAEKKEQLHRRGRRACWVFFVGAMGLVAFLIWRIYLLFTVVHVVCTLDNQSCSEDTMSLAHRLVGRSMFETLHIIDDSLSVRVQKKWPNTLVVSFTQPQILVTFTPSSSAVSVYSLTQNGLITATRATEPIPFTDLELEQLIVGTHVSPTTLNFYRTLVELITQPSLPVSLQKVVAVSSNEVHLFFDGRLEVVVREETIDQEMHSLQILLQAPTIEHTGKVFDLRFRDPVMRSQ
ncbi:hypothetical protein C5B42_01255 [Candidatus Cerribacteria bacterium 'Amazon FNV 2010 28 9']|uniref:POTRA domain-containing protein n=1 Tax=Candidatus Cerribacteria bacterium 'Amazon FNV 2010 28 9' TaxID=2081795 RepID=A0A317JTX6_9BACT|nr:MAG: hypothetical protein C5B42_01255 [Candidatus Cerribacteria bacterium 'Amazon FNV 2010 28 9']